MHCKDLALGGQTELPGQDEVSAEAWRMARGWGGREGEW